MWLRPNLPVVESEATCINGKTDEFGYETVVDKLPIHDIHTTGLHLMELDHEQLTYLLNGSDFRLTDVCGEMVQAVLA
ncbi:MAG: DUF1501 domain-containing protein [Pirellulales bacterium]|nr:DUF1501 domain-containing protein [Pirellulales bacterium]